MPLNTAQIWDKACNIMREEMTEVTFNTWIATALKPIDMLDQIFYIETATDFYFRFVEPRYSALISNALSQVCGTQITAKLLRPDEAKEFKNGVTSEPVPAVQNTSLNPKYTFDTFVVGNSNRFAHAASLAVAESPSDAYNPLFIYGGVGLGKTHLMHAIGHYILSQKPDTKICYLTAEVFTNEVIESIQDRKSAAVFREKYRNYDVLMIDDIQFIGGKDRTQEEFFHTFNALHDTNKQIIITSDRPPKEIPKLEERLCSRFEWGLIADISKPDIETRIAILRRKATEEMLDIGDDVLALIAENISSNIRELEGCLTRLVLYSSLSKKPITTELAREALADVFSRNEQRHISCEDVMTAVAEYYDVTVDDIKSPKRQRSITIPRQIAMYLSRELVNLSLPAIGEAFNRDHTTVMHACEKIAAEIKTSAALKNLVQNITHKLCD
ncbi:MAG: chromosomal replication initiator protein DnaA [Clostridiales bacterium]|nr:chromosomal replication initiator protein DnaA [Clostridiales bacterium]